MCVGGGGGGLWLLCAILPTGVHSQRMPFWGLAPQKRLPAPRGRFGETPRRFCRSFSKGYFHFFGPGVLAGSRCGSSGGRLLRRWGAAKRPNPSSSLPELEVPSSARLRLFLLREELMASVTQVASCNAHAQNYF
jgi:hypothetical protein